MPDHAATTIRSGPRYEAVLTAVGLADEALRAAAARGETELDERGEDLETEVQRVRAELEEGATASTVLDAWSGLDVLDEDVEEPVAEALMDLDLALGDLARAEGAVDATDALLTDLASPLSAEDREDGFDEAVRDEVARLAAGLRSTLASGAYLTSRELDDWADALRALGYRRAVRRPGVDDDADGVGFNAQRIEQFPPGRRFEGLAIYDGALFGVAMPDALADVELAEDPDAPGEGD